MKRTALILVFGIALGIGAFVVCHRAQTATARELAHSPNPELEWLRREFGLDEKGFEKARALHEQYMPDCAEMCGRIESANAELERLVMSATTVTPEIEAKLGEIGGIREECQARMLRHFYAVSQTMAPEQGKRYLREMHRLTSLSNSRRHMAGPETGHAH